MGVGINQMGVGISQMGMGISQMDVALAKGGAIFFPLDRVSRYLFYAGGRLAKEPEREAGEFQEGSGDQSAGFSPT
jgi:hypothetical protein